MNRCVKRRYHRSSQCSNCSTKYFSSEAISIRNSKCGHGNKEKQKRSAVAYESFWTAAIFQRYRQRSCPSPLLSSVRIFFYLSFFFFFSFHVSTLLPFERRETSRTNSPHPSALNRRLIHVATMKEEKCFVLAINNNEIHPVDVPCERYYSVSPLSPFLLTKSDSFLVFSGSTQPRPLVRLFFFIGFVRPNAIMSAEFHGEKTCTLKNWFLGRWYVSFVLHLSPS